MTNKILGTSFIKSKYEIESLTQEDIEYLKIQLENE